MFLGIKTSFVQFVAKNILRALRVLRGSILYSLHSKKSSFPLSKLNNFKHLLRDHLADQPKWVASLGKTLFEGIGMFLRNGNQQAA